MLGKTWQWDKLEKKSTFSISHHLYFLLSSLGFFYLLSLLNCILPLYSQSQDQAVVQQLANRSSAGVWVIERQWQQIQPATLAEQLLRVNADWKNDGSTYKGLLHTLQEFCQDLRRNVQSWLHPILQALHQTLVLVPPPQRNRAWHRQCHSSLPAF